MILAIIQARMGSARFPGKMLADVGGMPLIWHVVRRALAMRTVDRVVLATPHVWDGPEDDVVGRLQHVARQHDADYIVRICGDSPLWDVFVADRMVAMATVTKSDLIRFSSPSTFCGVDIMSRHALDSMLPGEHVRPSTDGLATFYVETPSHLRGTERLSIDTPEDLERLRGRMEAELGAGM